jgi:hypothetical protein
VTKQSFKRINFDENLEKYLLFELTPEKKLLTIIKNLKDVFPKQKRWRNFEEDKESKIVELLEKFQRRGKLYREVCKNWFTKNQHLSDEFTNYFQSTDKEISTEEVLKFFKELREKHSLNIKDIFVFIHVYVEQVLGMQLFEESALKLEEEYNKSK